MASTGKPERLNVLIVEHDTADAELCLAELTRGGFDVTGDVAGKEAEVLALLGEKTYDIVLADYRLPAWTGMDALFAIRAAGFDVPLILVTGTLGDERAAECIKLGAADYVIKDNIARLPTAVRHALREKREREESTRLAQQMHEAQRQIRDREERFGQLADNISEVFFVVDSHFRETLYINPAYEKVWGVSCRSVYEDPSSFLRPIPEEDKARVIESIGTAQRGEDPGEIEFRVVRPDGSVRWVLSHAIPIRNEHGEVYRISGVALDITDRRRLEDQFRHAQKMEAVGRLAGGVAHDFNNVLTIITSYSDFLHQSLGKEDPRRDDVEQIRLAVVAAGTLTRQLLAFSRQQIVEPRVINLHDVVAESKKMLDRLIGEDISLVTVSAGAPLPVRIDPGQLEQVIMNLAVNSRDAMPDGGSLTIETSLADLDVEQARAWGATGAGPFVMLAVSDTGVGMDEATQARVFEPFFTTKEVGKGTGLGLATVYGIVKQSGGFVWVYSEPEKGTTFKIYLPLSDQAAEEASRTRLAPPQPGTETVLLAEDDSAVRTAITRILQRFGYTVLQAPNGKSALDIAARSVAEIHLLLTDVVMPEMSGRQLGEEFAKVRPDARLLFMSGYTDDSVIRRGVLESGVAYLQKPFTPDNLARKVREVLDAPSYRRASK